MKKKSKIWRVSTWTFKYHFFFIPDSKKTIKFLKRKSHPLQLDRRFLAILAGLRPRASVGRGDCGNSPAVEAHRSKADIARAAGFYNSHTPMHSSLRVWVSFFLWYLVLCKVRCTRLILALLVGVDFEKLLDGSNVCLFFNQVVRWCLQKRFF